MENHSPRGDAGDPLREDADGVHIAYHVIGDGPIDVMWIQIRAGVHTGEVETIDGKSGGVAVHIGARVAALAGPSEILVSRTVKDLVAGSRLVFEDAGEHDLKGVPDPWRLYRVANP
jgi:class 3 adenylate cyclase